MQHIYTTNFCARKETLSISIPVNYEDLNDKNVYVAYKKVFNIKCLSNIEMCSLCVATFWRKKHPTSFQIEGFHTDLMQIYILLSYAILHNSKQQDMVIPKLFMRIITMNPKHFIKILLLRPRLVFMKYWPSLSS